MSKIASPSLMDPRDSDRPTDTIEDRVVTATRRCVARWGVAKTTLDDIAREAGCSRATIYRVFPGGKDVVLAAAWAAEVASFCHDLDQALARATTLEDAIVLAVSEACREIATHDAVQYLLEHEPSAILPFIAFDGLDPLLAWSTAFAVPHLRRFVADDNTAAELGEWVVRVILTYGFDPSPDLALADPGVARRFVQTFITPGVDAATAGGTVMDLRESDARPRTTAPLSS